MGRNPDMYIDSSLRSFFTQTEVHGDPALPQYTKVGPFVVSEVTG
jgi:hypothetical protein